MEAVSRRQTKRGQAKTIATCGKTTALLEFSNLINTLRGKSGGTGA